MNYILTQYEGLKILFQQCATLDDYYGTNGDVCSRRISKGCIDDYACQELLNTFPDTCNNYVDNPLCVFCHSTSLGNAGDSPAYTNLSKSVLSCIYYIRILP